jgi:RND family efflux transporter MFP subunit
MSPEAPAATAPRRGLGIVAICAVAILLVVLGFGIATRAANAKRLRALTSALAPPVVTVIAPDRGSNSYAINLPGRLEAWSRAPIYARVSGYLRRWNVDIGGSVQAGQLLGEIDAPDLDQQLSQAQADLLTAQANAALAGTTAKRWQQLYTTHSVSHQDLDVKNGDLAAKEAILKASRANVDRLRVLEGFKRIVAPFNGIVTARLTDIGDLIDAGGGKGRELFIVSSTRKLRLYVAVPQMYASRVTPGIKAQLSVPEHPGLTYAATVLSTAQSVEPSSGSTLVQLAVENAEAQLVPGAFANVHFEIPLPSGNLSVPASALIIDHGGVHVATLGADGRVAFKTVAIARDLGEVIEISAGLAATDQIIDSPPDGISTGDQVRVAKR